MVFTLVLVALVPNKSTGLNIASSSNVESSARASNRLVKLNVRETMQMLRGNIIQPLH